jgi:hypothetical protein
MTARTRTEAACLQSALESVRHNYSSYERREIAREGREQGNARMSAYLAEQGRYRSEPQYACEQDEERAARQKVVSDRMTDAIARYRKSKGWAL